MAWRLNSGVIRLDNARSSGEISFASLAVPGDILGCETMLFGCYTFSATALTQCELSPWPDGTGAMAGESLLASLAQAQKRAAEVVALRGGQAVDRVLGLIRLFTDNAGQVVLPTRQDIADITDLRFAGECTARIPSKRLSRTVAQSARSHAVQVAKLAGRRSIPGLSSAHPVGKALRLRRRHEEQQFSRHIRASRFVA